MNTKKMILSFAMMFIGAGQSLNASDDEQVKILMAYCSRPCVKVICCNPQGCTKDSVWMKCDTPDHAINSSLNVACCMPRCLLGSLCCACFITDCACYSIQEAQKAENAERDFICGQEQPQIKSNRERAQRKVDAMKSTPSSQAMEYRSVELVRTEEKVSENE